MAFAILCGGDLSGVSHWGFPRLVQTAFDVTLVSILSVVVSARLSSSVSSSISPSLSGRIRRGSDDLDWPRPEAGHCVVDSRRIVVRLPDPRICSEVAVLHILVGWVSILEVALIVALSIRP